MEKVSKISLLSNVLEKGSQNVCTIMNRIKTFQNDTKLIDNYFKQLTLGFLTKLRRKFSLARVQFLKAIISKKTALKVIVCSIICIRTI